MKSFILAIFLLSVVSGCGRSELEFTGTNPAPINLAFHAITQPAVLGDSINFSAITLNTAQPSNDLLSCDGSMGNSGSINGVASGMVRVTGTAQKGTIQFGNVAYVGATDSRCHDVSKEAYSYETSGSTSFTICLVNASYPYCTLYSL